MLDLLHKLVTFTDVSSKPQPSEGSPPYEIIPYHENLIFNQ
jgi:hypothetical protein